MTQNHPHAVRPKPGMNRITYIRVANGKKMMPSRGTSQVLKAAETSAGLATQTMNSASRGKSPANIANRQPIERSLHRARQASPQGVGKVRNVGLNLRRW